MGDSLLVTGTLSPEHRKNSLDDGDIYNMVLVMSTLSLEHRKHSLNDGDR